jgi:hypothetical protein
MRNLPQLSQVRKTGRLASLSADLVQHWQQYGDQHRDDANHDEQLDEGEAPCSMVECFPR